MKKIIIFILLTVLASAMVFAQSGDARVRGMGGAFTAVAYYINSIYLNPAGLCYIKEKNLVIGLDFNVEMKKRLVFGQEDFPSTWEAGWDPETNEPRYEYYDNFMGTNVAFDPAEYGFDTYDDYMAFYETYGFFSFADNTSNLYFIPHVAYAAKGWGVSTISEIGVDFLTEGGYDGENTPVNVRVTKKQGLMGAVGLGFGPLGIGANLKYYKNSSYSLNYTAGDYREGPPESFFQQIFIGP